MPSHDVRGVKHQVKVFFSVFAELLLHPILTVSQLPHLAARSGRDQRDIPSASVFCTPGMCVATWFHPHVISRRPSILMSRHALLSFAPPHRLTHVTAATLSPGIDNGSSTESGLSPLSSSIIHAFTTVPNSSRRLIVIVLVWRRAFCFTAVSSGISSKFFPGAVHTDRVEADIR